MPKDKQRKSLLRGVNAPASSLPDYGEPDDTSPEAPSGASGTAPSAVPGAAPLGLPNYNEPGEAAPPQGASGASGAGGAKKRPPSNDNDLPNYEDPGDSSAPAPTPAPSPDKPASQ